MGVCASTGGDFEHEDEIREKEAQMARKKAFSEQSLKAELAEEQQRHAELKAKEKASKREVALVLRIMERRVAISMFVSDNVVVSELEEEAYDILAGPDGDWLETPPIVKSLMPLWTPTMAEAGKDALMESVWASAPTGQLLRFFMLHDEDPEPPPKWNEKEASFFDGPEWVRISSGKKKFKLDEGPTYVPEELVKIPEPVSKPKQPELSKQPEVPPPASGSFPEIQVPPTDSFEDLLGLGLDAGPTRQQPASQQVSPPSPSGLDDLLFASPPSKIASQPIRPMAMMQPVMPARQPESSSFNLKPKLTAWKAKAADKVFETNWKTQGGEFVVEHALVKPVGVKELDAAMSLSSMHGIATQQMETSSKGYYMGEAESTGDLYLAEIILHTGDSLVLSATLKAVSADADAVKKFAEIFKAHLVSTGMVQA